MESVASLAPVTVVDLLDGGRGYSVEDAREGMTLFVMMVLRLTRANEGSAQGVARCCCISNQAQQFRGRSGFDKPYLSRKHAELVKEQDRRASLARSLEVPGTELTEGLLRPWSPWTMG
jgi:hypothetical protein